jgi:hypothetical protein
MTTTVLSPLAQPFHPIMGQDMNPTIYNDGVPTLTFQGSDSEFLLTIHDETLEEAFPPTAQDAAELEAVETFVALMANLAFLEEREENARTLHAGLKKRWEVRRGLAGRPRTPRHSVRQVIHGKHHLLDDSDEVVVYDHTHTLIDHRMRARATLGMAKPLMAKKLGKHVARPKPIQQPRKFY